MMNSQNGLRYLQFLHTDYNDVASSSPSLGASSTSQYPSEASVYGRDQHCNGGATAASYGYNNGSVYGYHNYPNTSQFFPNTAATPSDIYYNPSLFYGYSSGSAYGYPGYGNAPIAETGNMMASCSTGTRINGLLVQSSNNAKSKCNGIAHSATSVEMTGQSAIYPEMTAQGATYPKMTAQSATYPEMTTHSFTYPKMTTRSVINPEITDQSVIYKNMIAQCVTYPEMTAQSASSPEMTFQNAMSPEIIQRNMTQSTPITSFLGSGESNSAAYSVSFLAHSESLKKKCDNTKNRSGSKKTKPRNNAKRNLRYSPVNNNDLCTQTTGGLPECVSNTKVDPRNNIDYRNSTPLVQECPSVKDFDSNCHFTHNTNVLKYGSMAGSSVQNKSKGGYDQFKLTAPETTAYDNNITYFNENADRPIEMTGVNSTPERADNSTESSQEWYYDSEDEELLVGAPIQLKDYLEQRASMDFKTGHTLESVPMICKGCFHKTSGKKASTKSSEILSILLRDNGTADTSKTGKQASPIACNGITKSRCTDSMKRAAVDRKVNKSTKDTGKVNNDDITCRSPQEDPGCSQEAPEWMELSIEVVDELDQSSHLCFGCQKPVFDRYVIQVKDHGFWHADCLKCSNCQDNLSDQKSCYVKNEQVFCRNDYNILFGLSCVKCSLQFKREQDWMRVAGQHRYHIACFLCKICKRQLGNNEKYHLVNGTDIYCTNHYRDMVNGESSDGQQPPKKAKRNRTSYTEAQIKFLQDRFLRDSNPDGNELEKIATHINLKKRVVQVWFQNNRARLKKSANNSKNGNQENKNPINSGVAGNSALSDAMSIDWDNSLEQSSLDEHTYPNSASPSQMRPGSTHFMDTAYSLTPALSGPLLCLPSGGGASATMGQESGSLGDGSGTSTCGTPRDQVSPHFSDLSNPAYQGNESTVTGPGSGHDNSVEDVSGNVGSDYPGANNNVNGCGNKGDASPNVILSALRSSVAREKYNEGCQRRMDTRDHQEQDMRHHMMLFQDQSLRQHPHFHQQPYHSDLMYGPHMGIYGNLYNMYNSYGHLSSLNGDQNPELSDSHQSFLRMKTDPSQNSVHQVTEPPFDCHYSDSHIFGRSHLDINSGFSSARATFVDTNCHTTNTGNTASSGNSSPLSFLGAPNSQLHPRSSSGQCSFIQGHQVSSPVAGGPAHNYGRQSCASPGLIVGQNGGPSLQSLGRGGNGYFTENENA